MTTSAPKSVGKLQDLTKIAPGMYNLLMENDKVRVYELRIKPGQKVEMHSHPSVSAYSFSDANNKWTFPDGRTQDMDLKAGQVIWSPPFSHAVENTGTTETHLLVTELKE